MGRRPRAPCDTRRIRRRAVVHEQPAALSVLAGRDQGPFRLRAGARQVLGRGLRQPAHHPRAAVQRSEGPLAQRLRLAGLADRRGGQRHGPAEGAIMLIHGGGSDRRELTRHVRFYLGRHLDVVTLDVGCDGEAPCPVPGLTYGQRESRDVLSAYLFLTSRYDKVLAMGSSVGAASILVALPEMPKLKGVIAENPMASFQKLIAESPAARSIPSPRRMAAPRPPGFQTRASTAPSGMLITSTNSSQ